MTAPAIPWLVQLVMTVLCTGLCSGLFLVVYWQLWLLLRYRQKRLSCQSSVLFLCLLWAACRTVLFSFYLTNCARANQLQPFPHWLLYCSPICLQFLTLCLLNLYFFQVIHKASCSLDFDNNKVLLRSVFSLAGLAFLGVNVSCILIGNNMEEQNGWATLTRVIASDCLFALLSLPLASNVYKIANMSPAYVYLESKGTSGSQAVLVGSVIGGLYIVRALYNLVMVSIRPDSKPTPFSYGWNGLSDHAAIEETNNREYLIFAIFVIVCETVPMMLMAHFFRPQPLGQNLEAGGMVNSHSFGSRAYFFDNPRRYDSDDDLPRLTGAKGERGSLSSTPKSSGWYGTICPTSSCALAPPLQSEPPSGTPVLFTCGSNTLA